MAITLSILGSSSALPTSERFTSAHVLNVHEHLFLIDCGEGTQIRFRQQKLQFNKLNHIFISHLHGDHFFGIFGLLSSLQLLGRKNELHIYSFPGLENIILNTTKLFGEEFSYPITFHDLQNNSSEILFNDKNIEISSFPLNHRIPTCGFVFREKQKLLNIIKEKINEYNIPLKEIPNIKTGSNFTTPNNTIILNSELTLPAKKAFSYAYCSDTIFSPEIVPYIKGVDILYHEATFQENLIERAKETFHSTAKEAAEIAKLAEAKKLIIGHFSARYKNMEELLNEAKTIFNETYLAIDGLKINF